VFRTIVREPLAQFLVCGALLFAASQWFAAPVAPKDEILISISAQQNLAALHERTWGKPPTRDELAGLVAARVREEILAREAVALNLDQADPVLRSRLAQKLDFISDDLAAQLQPTEEDLTEFLEDHADQYALDAVYTFDQVFLRDPSDDKLVDARQALGAGGDPATLGDPLDLPWRVGQAGETRVAQMFGPEFVAALLDAPLGEWSDPILSAYGTHLVRLSERAAARDANVEDVRDALARDWRDAQRTALRDAYYEALRAKYDVIVEEVE
jgi:parvulin-like peptidyl-prolyl isomerase